MRPIKILTIFSSDFAKLWTPMTFENPGETRKTNTFRLNPDYCKRPHHPPMVYLRLPDRKTPDDMIDQLVNIVITEGPNASGTFTITKILVFPATEAKTPKYETHVMGFSYGKNEPGFKEHTPVLQNKKTIGNYIDISNNFNVVHLNLRSYSSSGRAWYDLHVIFKIPSEKVSVNNYWHGAKKEIINNTYQI